MKLSHVALNVTDLDKMKEFYEKYFGARSNNLYHNPKTGLKTYFLTFENGCSLELMNRPDITPGNTAPYGKGYIHIAFSAGGREKVDKLTRRLESDGCAVVSAPRVTGDGFYESCVTDPEGNQIEIVQ